jgi:hypothetical protein
MNYDERIAHIKQWFKDDMLARFTPPTGVDPKIVATDTIEAINSNLPNKLSSETLGNLLSSMTKEIARTARSRTLPIVKDFITAAHNASQALREGPQSTNSNPFHIDPLKRQEARIKRREPIPEAYLYGNLRAQLLAHTTVTEAELDRYSVASAAHTQYD